MRIAVLDDEQNASDVLLEYLKKYADENALDFDIGVYDSAEKLLEHYDCSYKILFLDIEMSGINGLQAADVIRQKDENVVIVFVTNMPQYALQGYEVGAVDFIIKPLTYEKFLLKIDKILRRLPPDGNQALVLRTSSGIMNIPISSIKYIEVSKNYLFYHTQSGIKRVRGTISDAEKKLDPAIFVRINNSYIINLKYVTKISATAVSIGDTDFTVSRGRKQDFMQQYLSFMEKV